MNEYLFLGISMGIISICMGFAAFISIKMFKRYNHYPLLFFSIAWISQTIFWILNLFTQIFTSVLLFSIAFPFQLLSFILLLVFIEYTTKERVNALTFGIFLVAATLLLFSYYTLRDIRYIEGYGMNIHGPTRIIQIFCFLYPALMIILWGFRILKNSPSQLRNAAISLNVGILIFTVVTLIFYSLGTIFRIYNGIGFIVHGFGVLVFAQVINYFPTILHILPYKVYSLSVIDSNSGIYLYHYSWDINQSQEMKNVFSSVLQSSIELLTKIIDRGKVQEIVLDDGVLLIQQESNYSLLFVLTASKSSLALKRALKDFRNNFIKKYENQLDNTNETARFQNIDALAKRTFSFLPK